MKKKTITFINDLGFYNSRWGCSITTGKPFKKKVYQNIIKGDVV
jgi:hypothetical protein